jgi:hypothetical protein
MSQDHNRLNHATWECKYHVVFTPKYRKKVLFGQIRRHLDTLFRPSGGTRRRSAPTSKIRKWPTSSWTSYN